MSDPIEVTLTYPGMRLDRALSLAHPDLSRMQWQKLIREGAVTIEGNSVKGSLKLAGDEVAVAVLPEVKESKLAAEDLPLDIRYEDDDLIVVNKSADMVVHPAPGHQSGTLVNAILYHFPALDMVGGEKRPGIVHRLDKATSGLMVVAKNDYALRHLQAQFKARTVHKAYLALVYGHIMPEKAMIDAPIGRDPKQRKKMSVIPPHSSATSRPAQTTYALVGTYDDYSLVQCTLHTGRTHQIRVHMAYAGFPLVGDAVYGRRKAGILRNRHFLHSAELGFKLPSNEEDALFKSELPPELQSILDQLNK